MYSFATRIGIAQKGAGHYPAAQENNPKGSLQPSLFNDTQLSADNTISCARRRPTPGLPRGIQGAAELVQHARRTQQHQLGHTAPELDKRYIIKFLYTLAGELDSQALEDWAQEP